MNKLLQTLLDAYLKTDEGQTALMVMQADNRDKILAAVGPQSPIPQRIQMIQDVERELTQGTV